MAALLAHQGGWDELLFVLAPLVVFAGLLVMARRRLDDAGDPASPSNGDDADPAGDAGPRHEPSSATTPTTTESGPR